MLVPQPGPFLKITTLSIKMVSQRMYSWRFKVRSLSDKFGLTTQPSLISSTPLPLSGGRITSIRCTSFCLSTVSGWIWMNSRTSAMVSVIKNRPPPSQSRATWSIHRLERTSNGKTRCLLTHSIRMVIINSILIPSLESLRSRSPTNGSLTPLRQEPLSLREAPQSVWASGPLDGWEITFPIRSLCNSPSQASCLWTCLVFPWLVLTSAAS